MKREFILTENLKRRLEKRKVRLVCRKCGKPIVPGEKVVSCFNGNPGAKRLKHYHLECYEKMWMEL